MSRFRKMFSGAAFALAFVGLHGAENVMLLNVPDYGWHAGCFGTASGNLMGYWDRNGFSGFYGASGDLDSVAPMFSDGQIEKMWASEGHKDDYWTFPDNESLSYESTAPDPYLVAGRPEHEPDCIGDFIGLSQNKWTDLDGECSGNIDAFSFNFWEKQGGKRVNYEPPPQNGIEMRDIQSGLRKWTQYRGYDADVFSQLADFYPETPFGTGFTFEDLKAEIDAGYPVLLYLQRWGQDYRAMPGMPRANPEMHGMLAYGYVIEDNGLQHIRFKTSWGSGPSYFGTWDSTPWRDLGVLQLRGVIGFRPKPKITAISPATGGLQIKWEGPLSTLEVNGSIVEANWFVVEKASKVDGPYAPVGDPVPASPNLLEEGIVVPDPSEKAAFFRVKTITRAEAGQ